MSNNLQLVNACRAADVRLISTALVPPSTWLAERLPPASYLALPAPPFTDEEARDLFQRHGGPDAWLREGAVSLVNAAAGGHPTLLIAGLRYLQSRDWRIDHAAFLNLIRGDPTGDVRRETVQRFVQLVADGEARDLLYRANIAMTPMSEGDVLRLAAVDKRIARPSERLHALMDVCIQRAPGGGLRVSPLFKTLGTADVPADTAAGCHAVLGAAIVARPSVGVDEAAVAIAHFLAANDHNRAAIVLLRALTSLNGYTGSHDGGVLNLFWQEAPLPKSIDHGLRMLIRANQALLYHRSKQPVAYVLDDLEALG